MAAKSPDAFRTISEVADWLGVPTHVLRFWESRFTQVKPVKRAGGRRYYRPSDMLLIGGIKKLLHEDGMTIRGVQKLLREEGVKHVAAHSKPLDFEMDEPVEATAGAVAPAAAEAEAEPENLFDTVADAPEPQAEVVSFRHRDVSGESAAPTPAPTPAPEAPASEPPAAAPAASAEPGAFGSSRDGEPSLPFIGRARDHAPPAPQIPPTPDVPVMDAEDDAPAHATGPGVAARLAAGRIGAGIDDAVLREVIEGLRAIRAA